MRRRTLISAAIVTAVRPAVLLAPTRIVCSTYEEMMAALATGCRQIVITGTIRISNTFRVQV